MRDLTSTNSLSCSPNQWLRYRRVGKWSDYLHGEEVDITLGLVAKSVPRRA